MGWQEHLNDKYIHLHSSPPRPQQPGQKPCKTFNAPSRATLDKNMGQQPFPVSREPWDLYKRSVREEQEQTKDP